MDSWKTAVKVLRCLYGAPILERIRNASSKKEFGAVLFDIAGKYGSHIGLNFDAEVRPKLEDGSWWKPKYGITIGDKPIGLMKEDAFRCLVDIHRTFQFAQAIRETVIHLQQQNKKSLTAIDAGTGTGILAILLAAYGVNEITAIELNPETVEATRTFLREEGLDDKITLIEGDATRIKLPNKSVDILVCENLSGGLMDEPQYEIISHLSQYLAPEAEIIPYRATLFVSAAYSDWTKTANEVSDVDSLAGYRNLSAEVPYAIITSHGNGMRTVPIIEEEVVIPLMEGATQSPNTLAISTGFQLNAVGEPHYIEPDSAKFLGSTTGFKIKDSTEDFQNAIKVKFGYRTGSSTKDIGVRRVGESFCVKAE